MTIVFLITALLVHIVFTKQKGSFSSFLILQIFMGIHIIGIHIVWITTLCYNGNIPFICRCYYKIIFNQQEHIMEKKFFWEWFWSKQLILYPKKNFWFISQYKKTSQSDTLKDSTLKKIQFRKKVWIWTRAHH